MRSSTARRPEAGAGPAIERARPLLGTLVSIRVEGVAPPRAHALIDAAFAEIAGIHRLMSFQDPASELSRINRLAAGEWLALDPRTAACLCRALALAALSDGAFDPVTAAIDTPRREASWHDFTLDGDRVRLAVPLRIDLSGIAKGFAVDRACAVLRDGGAPAAVVNAGGDLRVFGAIEEAVALRPFDAAAPAMILVADGALASSDPRSSRAESGGACHVDGRDGRIVADRFVSVAAPTCMDADALTKIALARGAESISLLAALSATAYVHDDRGWATMGAPA